MNVGKLVKVSAFLAIIATGRANGEPVLLLREDGLRYLGAFRVPAGSGDLATFEFGGTALSFRAGTNTLLLVGHDWHQRVAEISVPEPSLATTVEELPRATFVQPFADLFGGKNKDKIGGLLPWGDRLVVSTFIYYDAPGLQKASHHLAGVDFRDPPPSIGPLRVGDEPAGFVSGYMAPVPPEWQRALGGPAVTGNCCLPIISRTSFGPALSVFDPKDLGVKNPVPATAVLGYPMAHPTLGECRENGRLFNCAVTVGGVVFPSGTASVLFFGRRGMGDICYKDEGPPSCRGSGGYDAPPFVSHVWAYDARELASVRDGRKRPWDVQPYASWKLPFGTAIWGATYDPATRRVFLSEAYGDGKAPLIRVFMIPSSSET